MKNKITFDELRDLLLDVEVPDSELRDYLTTDPELSTAFNPVVVPNPDLVVDSDLEAAVAVSFLNRISRWRRNQRYKRRIKNGWKGPKLVSEGDSWFQYPLLLDDIIDHLDENYAIRSLGAAGDLLGDIVDKEEYLDVIEEESPDGFLISGGGNDMVGDDRLKTMLEPYHANRLPENYPNPKFNNFLNEMSRHYFNLFKSITERFPNVKILCHGYDHAIPNSGKWLGNPMKALNINNKVLQRKIVAILIHRFNEMLKVETSKFVQVSYVNCQKAVDPDQWYDELHPTNVGYAAVANRFSNILEAVIGSGAQPEPERFSPGKELFVSNPEPIKPDAYRKIVARQARKLGVHGAEVLREEDRHSVEASMRMVFEKIDRGADFQPARFLHDGARRAEAVCRIVSPWGKGTGFLAATDGFIMTNNHVLENAQMATLSQAEFGYENDNEAIRVALKPERLFITHKGLDFTIVACDPVTHKDIEPIPILRNPATVVRDMPINIIQHPRGRRKEIAIRNNLVTYVYETVVRYRTDTEPGSSGSAAFNDDWELVALHHAGQNEPNNRATNEGIRIAAIVAHLIGIQQEGSLKTEAFRELMSSIDDTSPFLGFFDVESTITNNPLEVEIPDFSGSRDYADVGVWNIEHFNGDVDASRVEKVADVIHQLSMDVMGLVEVEEPALNRLKSALTQRGDAYNYELLNVRGRQDIAVLYDQDTTKVKHRDDLNLTYRNKLDERTRGNKKAFPRDPMFAQCKVTEQQGDPVKFLMIVVHFKAFGDAISRERRRLASKILSEIIEDIRNTENLPVILCGDFNETLNTDVLNDIKETPDLFALTADDQMNNAISYVGQRYKSLIDHIVVSNDVHMGSISGDDAAIVRLDQSVSNFTRDISDHVPIVLRLIARDNPIDLDTAIRPGGTDDSNGPAETVQVHKGQEKLILDFQWKIDNEG